MRIIGGEAGGRSISSPKGLSVRPTSNMIREALFNILKSMQGVHFLDLYAGTGSVGLEALSRGAEKVVFIERNKRMAFRIMSHIQALNYNQRANVISVDAIRAIIKLSNDKERFDIIFADPPYEKDLVSRTIEQCWKSGLMRDGSLMVIQHSIREPTPAPQLIDTLRLVKQRRYGDTMLSVYVI